MAEKSTNGDQFVLNVQKWLNENYSGKTGYSDVTEDGYTGWGTINGLLRALQIQLGVKSPSDNFGTQTTDLFNKLYPSGIKQQSDNDTKKDNIYGIIQGALLCKGYSIGASGPTCNFYGGTGSAIKQLKSDAGINSASSVVTLNIMKALMSMDYFYSYDTSTKTKNIQKMQRYLNANYEKYTGLNPCDGIYARRTNNAMILAIQIEEGIGSNANGVVGDATKRCLPTLLVNGTSSGTDYNGQSYNTNSINKFKILANMALYFNGFGNGEISSTLDSGVIRNFQSSYSIPITGNIDRTTWLSLIISCGDTTRSAVACDCATLINSDNVSVIKNNNYKYIGRYLSGEVWNAELQKDVPKGLSTSELQVLFANGIRVFPIHQGSANKASYFTIDNAVKDAKTAYDYADKLKIQFGAIIYFAVDYDATDSEITSLIIPYFRELYSDFMYYCKGKYRVGIYGTRNVCKRVTDAGYACSCFVGDMSFGYSGNLGFSIPDNWAFDQFHTITISSSGKTIEIDKDGFSGRYKGISQEYSKVDANAYDNSILDDGTTVRILINMGADSIPVYASKTYVTPEAGAQVPNRKVDGAIIGYIKPGDFYLRYALKLQTADNVHRVMFNDGLDVKIGYVTEQLKFSDFADVYSDDAIDYQVLPNQDVFTCFHYNSSTGSYDKVDYGKNQEFTINKPVPYFSASGGYSGMLKPGDKFKIYAGNTINTGYSRPWANRIDAIKKAGQSSFTEFSGYVSSGLEYGNGSERAWY